MKKSVKGLTDRQDPSRCDSLPEGWKCSYLGEICTQPQYGWTTSSVNDTPGLKILRTSDISSGKIDWSTVPVCIDEPDDIEKYLLKPGDILISRAGSVGTSIIIEDCPRAIFASYLIRLRALPLIETKYIGLFLKSRFYWNAIADETIGITIPNVNASKIKKIPIPYPSVNEQRRIVAYAENILSNLNVARERLNQALLIMRGRFQQAILAAAFSGKLTKGNSVATEDWKWVHFGEILKESPQNGLYMPQLEYGEGYPIVRIDDFHNGILRSWASLKRVRLSRNFAEKYSLDENDILINRVNSMKHLGKSVLIPKPDELAVFESNMIRCKVDEYQVNPKFAVLYLLSTKGFDELRKNAKHAVNQSSINQTDVREVAFPVPSLPEQNEIVRQISEYLASRDIIERQIVTAQKRTEGVIEAVLMKVFRGNLLKSN